jgi:hypothetical protein
MPLNRRDFLRLTVRGKERVLELSCEGLYMRYVDARAGVGTGDVLDPYAVDWDGEPPLDIVVPTTGELFAELDRRLSGVQVLRVIGREWLSGDEFRREVESRIEAFRVRGGRVE